MVLLDKSIVEKMRKQTIKSVIDVIIIAELKNGSMSGYDVIHHIHDNFGVILSSGTVYSHLYSLERDGLLKGKWDMKKRVYQITQKGEQSLETLSKYNIEMLNVLQRVLDQ